MRILITGGAGYIGSILVPRLLEAGHPVRVLDSMRHGVPSLLAVAGHPNFEFQLGDARGEETLRRAMASCDVLIPLAAIVGAPACDRDQIGAATINRDAILLMNRLRSCEQRIIYPCTNSGYGTKSGDVFCTEDSPLDPITLYGRTKVEAERALLDSPNTLTVRLATVFGVSPRMRLDLLVNTFVFEAVTRRYLVVFEKDFKRNYVHIRDVADLFLHAIQNFDAMKGRPYNCGLDEANYSKAELAELVREQVPGFFVHYSEIGSDPDKRNYVVSNQRLREAGFEAKRTVRDGIRELIQAYQMLPTGPFANA
jgi:nucleoside-diphosphate-sugar epimerase